MRNMARSICSVGMRSFIVCFDTGSPAKVTSTVDGRNNAIGEALRQAQGDGKKEDGRDESRPYIELSRWATTSGRPYVGMSDHGGRIAIRHCIGRRTPHPPLSLRGRGSACYVPFGSAFFSTLGNSIFA